MNRRILRAQAFFIACVVAAAGGLGLLLISSPSHHRDTATPGLPPSLPRSAILTRVEIEQKVVALTFDFDMTPGMLFRLQSGEVPAWYDPAVFDILHREAIPHTMFLTGLATLAYPDLARSFARDPLIEIGNHSHRHLAFAPDCFGLPFIGEGRAQEDIETAQKTIRAITGAAPKYFRFPGGCLQKGDLGIVNHIGLRVVHWDVAAGDGFNPDAESIIRRVETRARPGSIIVFHVGGPNAPETAEALQAIIPYLKARGYAFATVTGLLDIQACSKSEPALRRFFPLRLFFPAWKSPCPDSQPVL
ncbi:MAG TPA: polysaccharide deacetylase family protein [bacterium]|nr:polysaccharide deacetylase family protein [bacterium]